MIKTKIIRLTESDLHNMIREAVTEVIRQDIGSEKTSRNQLAGGFKYFGGTSLKKNGKPRYKGEPAWKKGMVNANIGGGAYDKAEEYLRDNFNAIDLVFDPFSRDAKHNGAIFDKIEANGGADSVTCFNCLNVIQEPEARDNVILQCSQVLKPGGKAYFQVYSSKEEFENGGSRPTADGWQEFRPTKTYIPEIQKHFRNVICKDDFIIATDPIESEVDAEWRMDKEGNNIRTMKRFR